MNIKEIVQQQPFMNLFPVDNTILIAIQNHMTDNGYDESQPIIIWNGIVIDGNTRLSAAINIGLIDIPVVEKQFKNESEALTYAIHNQRDRRNITDADILRCISVLDKRQPVGRPTITEKELPPDGGNLKQKQRNQTSAQKTSEIIGISTRKVERARTVLDFADDDIKKDILNGNKTINKAYTEVQERKIIEPKSKFNNTNESIDWAKYSWNPVTGCKFGCNYCYARDIAMRFNRHFDPEFHESRLDAPKNTKPPAESGMNNVFVCSMADLFGDWVPKRWINMTLDVIKDNPQWNYLLLTKNPKRYLEFTFPDNCWLGATTDIQKRMDNAINIFNQIQDNITFVSCEPLLEPITITDNANINWVIIGGQSKTTGAKAFQPEWEWVESLLIDSRKIGAKVFFKPNLTIRPQEKP